MVTAVERDSKSSNFLFHPNENKYWVGILTFEVTNTTFAEFPNTVNQDETAHNQWFHLDLQFCLLVFEFLT